MFDYIRMPLMENEGDTGGNDAGVAGQQVTAVESSEQAQTSGAADQTGQQIPKDDEKSTAWAEMRRKAKEADELKKKITEYEGKAKTAEDLEKKLKKLEKALPEGYSTIDEFLESDEYRGLPEKEIQPVNPAAKPQMDESIISTIAKKAIEEHPYVQATKSIVERDEKRKENEYLVANIKKLQEKFPDIKEIKDVPYDVLEAWLKNEVDNKKYNRTLVSYYYEIKGDELIEKAKKQAVGQVKTKEASTSHTSKVQGTSAPSELDSVVVPAQMQKLYQGMKIPQDKWKQHYVKYLKNRGG